MAHSISGLLTSFKYEGELPYRRCSENFSFIPYDRGQEHDAQVMPPFDELTAEAEKLGKDLSSQGAVAFVETEYFGGIGVQAAIVWLNGDVALGPLTDWENAAFSPVSHPINQALQLMGVVCSGGEDEFDTVGLGQFRSNEAALRPKTI